MAAAASTPAPRGVCLPAFINLPPEDLYGWRNDSPTDTFSCSYTSEGVLKALKNCSVALQEGNEVTPAAALGTLLLPAWRISHPDDVLIDRLNPGMKVGNMALHK